MSVPHFSAEDLVDFGSRLFVAAGVSSEEATVVSESLVLSNMRGHDSHGIMRIPSYVELMQKGSLLAGTTFEVLAETPAVIHGDAGYGFGQRHGRELMDRVIEKSRGLGIACGTARHCGHLGRLGEFTEQAARQNLAAFGTVNDNGILRVVAPPGGTEPRISTNPLSIAVPTSGRPLVFDGSTSAVAQGKVLVRQLADQQCPEGWLQDSDGNPTTNPHVLHAQPTGTLLPLGGDMSYKGFGLGLTLDVLVGGLSGGYCPPPRPDARNCNSVLFVAWDPELFGGLAHLQTQATELLDSVRNCARKPGVEQIQVPGDTSSATEATRRRDGIPLKAGNWTSLAELAETLNVATPSPLSADR